MGVKFGDINASQILENEFRIMVLERIIEHILKLSPKGAITNEGIENIRKEVILMLQKKYPNSAITLKKE